MELKYAKFIAGAFQTVLESFSTMEITNTDISTGKPAAQDIQVMIGIVGDVDGHVYMSMNATAGQTIASKMLGDMEIEEEEIVHSAVSELCNMVMGNACASISADNTQVDIKPPVVVQERDAAHMDNMCNIRISLDALGNVDFDLSLKPAS